MEGCQADIRTSKCSTEIDGEALFSFMPKDPAGMFMTLKIKVLQGARIDSHKGITAAALFSLHSLDLLLCCRKTHC